jgi:hypothetical protein
MEAQPVAPNSLLYLLRAEGALLIVLIGILLTVAAIALLILPKRPVVYAIHGAFCLVPLVIGPAGMFQGYSEFSRMAAVAVAPEPAELAAAVMLMASSGILGLVSGLVPLALCFLGILIRFQGIGTAASDGSM